MSEALKRLSLGTRVVVCKITQQVGDERREWLTENVGPRGEQWRIMSFGKALSRMYGYDIEMKCIWFEDPEHATLYKLRFGSHG